MILAIADDYDDLSRQAARRAAALLRDNPASAIIVATGETPMGMYRELAELKQQGAFDTSRLRIFQLDEYLGVGEDDERSLYGWMKRSFLDPLGIRDDQVVRLRGDAADPEEECRAFDRCDRAGWWTRSGHSGPGDERPSRLQRAAGCSRPAESCRGTQPRKHLGQCAVLGLG